MSTVQIAALRKEYGSARTAKAWAVDGLDLTVEEGEFLVLLGPSGCGKTTTLRCIAGLEEPTHGEIRIGAQTVAAPQRNLFVPPERRQLGMVFQSYALWPHMTVFDNVAYPVRVRHRRIGAVELGREVRRALDLVGLDAYEARYPGELSGGQQQRVALARALVGDLGLLLFDEPLSNLDAQLRVRLRRDLKRIQRATGRTAIYVTHDQSEALALADRVAVLRDGRLEQLGAPSDIYCRPATRFVADFLGFENIWPAIVRHGNGASSSVVPAALGIALEAGAAAPGQRSEVELAVRAENVLVLPAAAAAGAAPNVLAGRLLEATYVGAGHIATVEVASPAGGLQVTGTLRPGDWPGGMAFGKGALPIDVAVSIPPRGIHLL
jgi:iron(III) transport system ATP-binding protein